MDISLKTLEATSSNQDE